jgi:hypothetical protein
LPTFDGTDAEFQIFWMRFKAYYAKVYKFASALKIGGEADMVPGTIPLLLLPRNEEETKIDTTSKLQRQVI